MKLNENLFEDIEENLNEAYSARWDNMVTYSNPIKQQYADLVNDQIYDALDNIDILASSKISDLPEQTDFRFDQAERVSKAISNLVRTMTREYFLFTDLKDESLKENVEYIKWVQLPNGKWKIWGSNSSSELDPEFLDRARKFNKVNYLDAKVYKNGEYPEDVSEEDVEEIHRFVKESVVVADNTEIVEPKEEDYRYRSGLIPTPYSKDEVDKELKLMTNDWTKKDGIVKVYYDEELKHVKDLLSDHYEHVETSKGPQGWKVVAYKTPKKED